MTSRLLKYLNQTKSKEWGCKERYEKGVMYREVNYAYLAGHYAGMLDELIAMIGHDRVAALVAAHDDVMATMATMATMAEPSPPTTEDV